MTDPKKWWKDVFDAREIVKLRVKDDGGNGGVSRGNGGVSARKRAGKAGKKG